MKQLKRGFLFIAFFAAAVAAQAQNVDEVISKHLDAIGGKEKLSGISSVKMTNTNEIMGNQAPAVITIVNGKGYRSEAEVMGSKMVQVYTEKGAWMINPMMGSGSPEAMPDEAAKAGQSQIYVEPFLDYAAKGAKAEYAGQEKLGSVNAHKVKLTDKNGMATTYYIDPTTYYIVRAVRAGEMMGQPIEITLNYSDFKKTDYGWVVPQTTEINMGQFAITSKLKNLEVNAPVDPAVFEMKK